MSIPPKTEPVWWSNQNGNGRGPDCVPAKTPLQQFRVRHDRLHPSHPVRMLPNLQQTQPRLRRVKILSHRVGAGCARGFQRGLARQRSSRHASTAADRLLFRRQGAGGEPHGSRHSMSASAWFSSKRFTLSTAASTRLMERIYRTLGIQAIFGCAQSCSSPDAAP